MTNHEIKAYALGQKPDETNPQRFIIEAHPAIELINAMVIEGGRIAVAGSAPTFGPKVLIPIIVAQAGEPITLMIGETLGRSCPPIAIPTGQGAVMLYVIPVWPRPDASSLKVN